MNTIGNTKNSVSDRQLETEKIIAESVRDATGQDVLARLAGVCVYALHFIGDRCAYISATDYPESSRDFHLERLRKGKHLCAPLQAMFEKIGEAALKLTVLETFDAKNDEDVACHRQRWISQLIAKHGREALLNRGGV